MHLFNRIILLIYRLYRASVKLYTLGVRGIRLLDEKLADRSPFVWLLDRLPVPYGVGHFLPDNLSIESFLAELDRRGINYVVLRWFEGLPDINPGDDIDILIADNDTQHLGGLFTTRRTERSCDIYTVSAVYGYTYRNLSYFPPYLASQILKTKVRTSNGVYVPNNHMYFLSLAFHALYHKSDVSGFASHGDLSDRCNKYKNKLQELASEAAYFGKLVYNELDEFLQENGWRPPFDTLRRLSVGTQVLASRVPEPLPLSSPDLLVFIVREIAVTRNQLSNILEQIKAWKLQVSHLQKINDTERITVSRSIRGGEWGTEDFPYPVPAGGPACVIVALDFEPTPPSLAESRNYPFVRNRKALYKHKLRRSLNASYSCFKWTNSVHCSDDVLEALDYILLACPDYLDVLISQQKHLIPALELLYSAKKIKKL